MDNVFYFEYFIQANLNWKITRIAFNKRKQNQDALPLFLCSFGGKKKPPKVGKEFWLLFQGLVPAMTLCGHIPVDTQSPAERAEIHENRKSREIHGNTKILPMKEVSFQPLKQFAMLRKKSTEMISWWTPSPFYHVVSDCACCWWKAKKKLPKVM